MLDALERISRTIGGILKRTQGFVACYHSAVSKPGISRLGIEYPGRWFRGVQNNQSTDRYVLNLPGLFS